MIMVTKDEKEYISENFPRAHIVRTMKQKSKRHRYYVEETPGVMRYLESVRHIENGKADHNGFSKKNRRK